MSENTSSEEYLKKKLHEETVKQAEQGAVPASTVIQMLFYTFLMVTGPISSYYIAKNLVFEGFFKLTEDASIVPSALTSIVVVHVVLGLFIYAAYTEKVVEKKKTD
ncbi:vacuolar ATPase assembly integral membrane protein VMA21-like [Styela clava]